MLDIGLVRENPEKVKAAVAARMLDSAVVDVDALLNADRRWRQNQTRVEQHRHRRKELSARIPQLENGPRIEALSMLKSLKAEIAKLESAAVSVKKERDRILKTLPNLVADDVPIGPSENDNLVVRSWSEPPAFSFPARDHVELGRLTDTLDFERGAKVAGTSFYYLKHEASLLEFALLSFAADRLLRKGFVPIVTPDLARDRILEGIGYQPRGPSTQVYSVEGTNLSLVGTSEITLGGLHASEILDDSKLPLQYLGFSHCFRTEAGAHGRQSRGLYRVHQFTKAEMFVFCAPKDSVEHHERLVSLEEELFQALEIPYRVVNIASGDLGAPAFKKYDLEAWMPGRNTWGEVTSCSNCTDYQSRRLGIRYRPSGLHANLSYVHMLNGTALAASRALVAIYENYQQQDGSIAVPKVLRPWMYGRDVIPVRVSAMPNARVSRRVSDRKRP